MKKSAGKSIALQQVPTEFERGKKDFATELKYRERRFDEDEASSALRSLAKLIRYATDDGNKDLDCTVANGFSCLLEICAGDLETEERVRREMVYRAMNGKPSVPEQRRRPKVAMQLHWKTAGSKPPGGV